MILKYVFILSIVFYGYSNGLTLFREVEDLLGTPLQACLNCLCHARTGCWNRLTCAAYSITKDYWKNSGAPTMDQKLDENDAYRKCMGNENCVLNTIKMYTESFGSIDCNSDGVFDCKDRFAIHIFGDKCHNPHYGATYARRFNDCSRDIGVDSMEEIEIEIQ